MKAKNNYDYVPKFAFGTRADWIIPLPRTQQKPVDIKTVLDLLRIKIAKESK